MVLVLDSAAVSTTGPRPDNQDSACAAPLLIALADGVGGNVGGAVASSLVVNWLAPLGTGRAVSGASGAGPSDLVRVVTGANERIRAAYTERPRLRSMATTMTAVYADGEGLLLAHIGDSRGYQLREGMLVQLSTDHTLVQAMIDAGELTVEEARVHPQRSAVYAALHGGDDDLGGLDLLRLDAQPGDRLMVCSDGLSDVVRPDRIGQLLAGAPAPAEAAAALRDAALAGPPTDNITVVVADVRAADPADPQPRLVKPYTVGAAVDFREETAEALEALWPGRVPAAQPRRRSSLFR
ncbi:Serine/threonine protein phosphatase PrpC [Modestobacter sp. DSM 44400]|uniref:PP2C family protein-serine/threonine phosphatase n=1 Tax=Modestobacter sp. DSM 44400 TaxID=1550230 RepID=UPI000895B56E|nr:protein phosphatase 2C domain-containing protein [Modestobacter sp. DSM 44400]SDY68606.1 Serine/threonine protein phosphatase PrpC [Modestobacter sp. DSM 44400]